MKKTIEEKAKCTERTNTDGTASARPANKRDGKGPVGPPNPMDHFSFMCFHLVFMCFPSFFPIFSNLFGTLFFVFDDCLVRKQNAMNTI